MSQKWQQFLICQGSPYFLFYGSLNAFMEQRLTHPYSCLCCKLDFL